MVQRTKTITIGGRKFELRRFSPDVGSYLVMKILGAGMKGVREEVSSLPSSPPSVADKPSPEDMARAMIFSAFLKGFSFEDHQFVQNKCLAVCSRIEGTDAEPIPMPIITGGGLIMPEIRDNMELVLRLETEALVFNLSDFFATGGLEALVGAPQGS